MPSLEPGKPRSPVAAYLPDFIKIIPPAADLPAMKAAWSGVWSGWACRNWACATRLAVVTVTTDGAWIIYSFVTGSGRSYLTQVQARFVGDELQADFGGGSRVSYRMRPDSNVEFMWSQGQNWAVGILTKDE